MQDTGIMDKLGAGLLSGAIGIVDCTNTLGPSTPVCAPPGQSGDEPPDVEIHPISEYDSDGPFWAWNWLRLGEHSGTHLKAPRHWNKGHDSGNGHTDTLNVQQLVAPANVIDCSREAANDPDFLLTADRIREWEVQHGEINEGEWVLMRTDWDKRVEDRERFLNANHAGLHYPGPSPDCIDYLMSRKIAGWGTQTVSIDAGMAATLDPPFPAHEKLLGGNCLAVAALASLDRLPAKGAIFMATPLKLAGGTGSPIRALALIPDRVIGK